MRIRKDRVIIAILILILFIFLIFKLITFTFKIVKTENYMDNLSGYTEEEAVNYANKFNLKLEIIKKPSKNETGKIYDQSIKEGEKINKNDTLQVYIADIIDYNKYKVNELGNVPIMMYHGIHNTEAKYIGGNVDKDGYQRTASAFRQDLQFYYENGYRMIRLNDYIDGYIDVELGFSPIIITFDDGLENNIKVIGTNEDGSIIIDPNSAVGILEEFKAKYPDFNVTATFFVNGSLFNQSEYNKKILDYLISHGYDIGNHTYSHVDFTKTDSSNSIKEVGSVYNILDEYIKGKYVNIVALPFGSPYSKTHDNFKYILSGTYEGVNYNTKSTLRVGWEAEYSPFNKNFDKTFLKRIRAYDNDGVEFDIKMNFDILSKNRYISDGDKSTITIPSSKSEILSNNYNFEVITY